MDIKNCIDRADIKNRIAKRIAEEIKDGDVVNLGIGTPELVSNYISSDKDVWLQGENGIIGMGKVVNGADVNVDVYNAGRKHVATEAGGCYFDSATSFGIIRGGHVDVTVLGVLEVDREGSFASHTIPGERAPGMGGAMDLVVGTENVIVAATHTKKGGVKTIVNKLSLPVTAVRKVKMIVTELAVIHVTPDGLVLKEIAEGFTPEEVQKLTEPELIVSDALKYF